MLTLFAAFRPHELLGISGQHLRKPSAGPGMRRLACALESAAPAPAPPQQRRLQKRRQPREQIASSTRSSPPCCDRSAATGKPAALLCPRKPACRQVGVVSEWKQHQGKPITIMLITKMCLKIALLVSFACAIRRPSLPGLRLCLQQHPGQEEGLHGERSRCRTRRRDRPPCRNETIVSLRFYTRTGCKNGNK